MNEETMVVLSGPFTREDITDILAAVRRAEQRQPEHDFKALIDVPGPIGGSAEDAAAKARGLLEEVFPRLPDGRVDWGHLGGRAVANDTPT